MWTVHENRLAGYNKEVECQYLTNMLDAVKAAAIQEEVVSIVVVRVGD